MKRQTPKRLTLELGREKITFSYRKRRDEVAVYVREEVDGKVRALELYTVPREEIATHAGAAFFVATLGGSSLRTWMGPTHFEERRRARDALMEFLKQSFAEKEGEAHPSA